MIKEGYSLPVSFERAKDGSLCAKVCAKDRDIFLHSRYSPKKDAVRRINLIDDPGDGVLLVLGVGLGYELEAAIESGRFCTIYAVYFSEAYKASESLQNAVASSINITVKFISAPDFEDDMPLGANLREFPGVVIENEGFKQAYPDFFNRIYAGAVRARVALLSGDGVVAPFISKDMADGFIQNGCAAAIMPLRKSRKDYADCLLEFNPDFIFSLDGAGFDFEWVRNLDCPKGSWFVDNPFYFFTEKTMDRLGDYVFCWDKAYLKGLRKMGACDVSYLPLATNPKCFFPVDSEYVCDVSFVGSISSRLDVRENLLGKDMASEFSDLLDRIVSAHMRSFVEGRAPERFPEDKIMRGVDQNTRLLLESVLDYECSTCMRIETIRAVSSFRANFYGGGDLPFSGDDLEVYGKVDYRTDLPGIYRSSKININVTRPQLKTTVNQRVFDVAAAGGFLLTDYRSGLDELFSFDVSDVVFSNVKELKEKVAYFLARDDERQAWARKKRQAVLDAHTYRHRAAVVLEKMGF